MDNEVDVYWKDYWTGRMRNQHVKVNSNNNYATRATSATSRSSGKPISLPHKQFIALYPTEWMREQRNGGRGEGEFICPSCHTTVGGWKENGLDICVGSCLYADLYYVDKNLVRINRHV
ncbi:hypothetical protein EON63_24095 [archaeon]|nr:MAG: hypothetical protein EON63_24095 [archaeon]